MSTHLHSAGDVLINRYKVLGYIDEGGMQQVYKALDTTFGRNVALKVPKTTSAEKRFARSARMSAKVIHANVAQTLDYFESNGKSYLIEELIDGVPFWNRLDKEFQMLDPHLAAHVIHQLSKAVAASHHAGVFHRDLKPSNIMVSRDPAIRYVKVTDFGIAKMAEEEIAEAFKDKESTTGSQTVMGALPYMAPEMIENQSAAGLPADIWAIGALLYQLLSGVLPFGRGLGATKKILDGVIPSKPALFAQKLQFQPLGEGLWAIVTACLSKEPSQRPTADQLVQMCAALCYSDAVRRTGTISEFAAGPGQWGKIDCDGLATAFFHADSYYGEKIVPGQKVNFAMYPGSPYPRAFPVLKLKD